MSLKMCLLFFTCLQFVMAADTYEKVNLTYSYQARCPYCLQFVDSQFYSGYNKLSDYINLELLPLVRVSLIEDEKISDEGVITCAHGDNECFISRAQACAFERPGVTEKVRVEYLYCTETKAIQGNDVVDSDIENCVNTILKDIVSYDTVKTCMNDKEPDSVLKAYNDKADQYGIEFVPWLGIFGQFDDQTEQHLRSNFVKTICQKLSNPPDVCNEK